MNYQEMSDFEINKLVALEVGGLSFNDEGLPVVKVIDNTPGSYSGGEYEEYEFDPCNSWADAGHIAEENFISFDQHYNGSYAKVWGYSGKGLHEISVLRNDLKKGICIVFLMMKGGE